MLNNLNWPLYVRMHKIRLWTNACLALWLCGFLPPAWAVEKVYYLDDQVSGNPSINFQYSLALLQLAIVKTGNKLAPEPYKAQMPKKRSLMALKEGRGFDIYWGVSAVDLERDLLPVKICLMKGLMGWRIPLVTQKNQHLFQNTKSLSDLRLFTAGQGTHWADTKILRAANLKVETSTSLDLLTKMLVANRFDYLPRAVIEISEAGPFHPDGDVVLDRYIAIHYNNPFYFFFNRSRPDLANMVQKGLEIAIRDGSFEHLFYQFYGKLLHTANIEGRAIIEVDNPLLVPPSPAERKALWHPAKTVNFRN